METSAHVFVWTLFRRLAFLPQLEIKLSQVVAGRTRHDYGLGLATRIVLPVFWRCRKRSTRSGIREKLVCARS